MELKLRKSILFDVIDGIPLSGNESKAVKSYRKDIEQSNLTLEEEAMNLGISRNVIEFTEDFRQMSRQKPKEVELLEICDYFEKVLRDGSRNSIVSVLELLGRDNCPYTPILKAKGIIEQQKAIPYASLSNNKMSHYGFIRQLLNQC